MRATLTIGCVRPLLASLATGAALLIGAPAASAGTLVYSGGEQCDQGPEPWTCPWPLRLIEDDGSNPRRLSPAGQRAVETYPSWSPDGGQLVFQSMDLDSHQSGLLVMNADGGGRRPLVERALAKSGRYFATDVLPDWSPKGDLIAFSSERAGDNTSAPGAGDDLDLFIVRPDGRGLRRIVGGPGSDETARFSPDGERLMFFRAGAGGGAVPGTGHDTGWYSVKVDGSGEYRLTTGDAFRTSHAPSGRYVAITNGVGSLWTMRADGRDLRARTGERGGVTPRLAWASDDTLFFNAPAGLAPLQTGGAWPQPYSVYRLDPASTRPPRELVRAGGTVDWTAGAGDRRLDPRDRAAPATLLVAGRDPLAGAAGHRRGRGPLAGTRRTLGYYASDVTGIRSVQVAIARRTAQKCRFRTRRRWSRARSCRRPLFARIAGRTDWRSRLRRLGRGTYLIGLSAVDVRGNRTRNPLLLPVRLR